VPADFEARIDLQNSEGRADGRHIKVVTADEQSTHVGVTAAAQTLVEQKHAASPPGQPPQDLQVVHLLPDLASPGGVSELAASTNS
jgi:hypothetical protein